MEIGIDTSGEDKKTTPQESDGHGYTGKEKKKCELTADMPENRQSWKMMVKTGPQRRREM